MGAGWGTQQTDIYTYGGRLTRTRSTLVAYVKPEVTGTHSSFDGVVLKPSDREIVKGSDTATLPSLVRTGPKGGRVPRWDPPDTARSETGHF